MMLALIAKATLILTLSLVAAWMARRRAAAVRHALLAAAFGALLALPLASWMEPPVRLVAPVAAPEVRAIPVSEPMPASLALAAAVPHQQSFSPTSLLLGMWIAGMCGVLLPVIVGLWQVRRLRRSALPWMQGQAVANELAGAVGVRRRVAVMLHAAAPGPMTYGVVRPAILLPEAAPEWDADALQRALVHELEHVRRCDWLSQCVARVVCAVYWFHPLVWMAWNRLTLEAERACDDAVLCGSEATDYADQLLALARRLKLTARTPSLAMANRADLTTRVSAMLDSGQRRGPAGKFPVALACGAAALLVVTLAPLTLVALTQTVVATRPPVAAPEPVVTPAPAPKRPRAKLLATAAAPPLQSTAPRPSMPTARFNTETGLVIVDVAVTDFRGRYVSNLQARDFAVTEDGVREAINVFEVQENAPNPERPNNIATYYVLGYYSSNDKINDQLRKIEITIPELPNVLLNYRHGYFPHGVVGNDSPKEEQVADPSVKLPQLISKVEPAYSEPARKAKFQGTVVVQVEIDTAGNVLGARVMRSLGLGLDEKAIEAVKQWKFKPGTKDGVPVTMRSEVTVTFRLL